jgi:DNA-binding CsgD family transcriptional regulator
MTALSDDSLADRIYEAAIVPELWKSVLDEISLRADAAGTALLLISNGGNVSSVWSDSIHDLCTGWVSGGWQAKTQRAPRMMALNHAGFVTEVDIYAAGELEQDEAYANYLKPAGYGYGAGTGITMPTGEAAVYSIERFHSSGPYTREDCQKLDPLRPHLARAALLSGRAGIERARTMASALQTLGLPGGVIRQNGRLLAANDMFERLMPEVVQDRRSRLRWVNANADRLFERALTAIAVGAGLPAARSIPVPSTTTSAPLIVHLLPVRGKAHDFYLDGSLIMVVTPVDRSGVPSAHVLQGLFDLTPAEAKVAQSVAGAQSVDSIAEALGIKRETVRTHLKAVLGKTGVGRQAELVSLLGGKTFTTP